MAKQVFWLDEARGLSPIKMEIRMRNPAQEDSSGLAKEGEWIEQSSDTQWEERARVWGTNPLDYTRAKAQQQLRMELTWESVNNAVPDNAFEPEGFGLPPGTAICDLRFREPIIESIVGRKGDIEPVDGKRQQHNSAPGAKIRKRRHDRYS